MELTVGTGITHKDAIAPFLVPCHDSHDSCPKHDREKAPVDGFIDLWRLRICKTGYGVRAPARVIRPVKLSDCQTISVLSV